jgi:hypothetical protein
MLHFVITAVKSDKSLLTDAHGEELHRKKDWRGFQEKEGGAGVRASQHREILICQAIPAFLWPFFSPRRFFQNTSHRVVMLSVVLCRRQAFIAYFASFAFQSAPLVLPHRNVAQYSYDYQTKHTKSPSAHL